MRTWGSLPVISLFSIFFFIFSFFPFFFVDTSLIISDIFFHTIFSTSNNTQFCTMVAASTGFSKSLVTSVMLCPAHRWMR
jgi:hypothetical protein